MKKVKIMLFLAIISVMVAPSCENVLDLAPEDFYASRNFWNNEAQVQGFVFGVHNHLRAAHFTFFLLGEARGGLQKHGISSTQTSLDHSSPIKDQDFTADKPGVTAWAGFYGRILNLNHGIQKVENETPFLSEASRNFFLGQLYGLRAFNYFWLYRTYGGVPIVTEVKVLGGGVTSAEPLYTARSTPRETLDFIKADIERSLQHFGNNNTMPQGRSMWSRFASLMLKAEVYLWSAKVTTGDQSPAPTDLATAEEALRLVRGNFTLQPVFRNVFAFANKGNSEIIFALRFTDPEATNFANLMVYSDPVFVGVKFCRNLRLLRDTLDIRGTGLLRHEYIFPLFESYHDLDTRKTATFLDFYDRVAGQPVNGGLVLRKFLGRINPGGARVFSDDIPIYRYAETLLMLAEVVNMRGGDPSPYINLVRARAFGANFNPLLHGHTNQGFAANELAILFERDKEFVWENKRWFDVRRMHDANGRALVFSPAVTYGRGTPVLDFATEAHKVLWPVDRITLGNDPLLTQTPGY